MADNGYRKLSVNIPVYNERNTVAEAVRRARSADIPLEREILAVDDGSDDGSGQILAQLEDSTVRVFHHPANRGKGAAIRTALAGKARVVYGSRFTGERRNMLFWHWLGNRFLALVTNVLYDTTLSDVETGAKLFDRTFLSSIPLRSERFGFEPEVTAKVLRTGERIYEVPVSYAGRELDEGKKISWKDGVAALGVLIRCRLGRGARSR